MNGYVKTQNFLFQVKTRTFSIINYYTDNFSEIFDYLNQSQLRPMIMNMEDMGIASARSGWDTEGWHPSNFLYLHV